MKFALMAGVGTLLAGFIGLIAWEFRRRRVTHTDEITTDLGVKLLGTVPPLSLGAGTKQTIPPTALVEAIDTARTMLLHTGTSGCGLRTVLVTSAIAGEGKTSLSGHLAISLARAGFRTLLVDGDLQSPSAHRLYDLPCTPGLCEVLRGEVDTMRAIHHSPIPGLSILPAGNWNLAARQSLVGDRWRRTKHDLESQFDFLVIDTAPLLLVTDTMLFAREADGVVLSVLHGVSQVSHVAETAQRLQAIGAKLSGAIVSGIWNHTYTYRPGSGATQAASTIRELPLADAFDTDNVGTRA